jgi:hypothetical protein
MLPLTLQFIAMVAHALNERLARRVDYLQKKVRVLREALARAPRPSWRGFGSWLPASTTARRLVGQGVRGKRRTCASLCSGWRMRTKAPSELERVEGAPNAQSLLDSFKRVREELERGARATGLS